MTPTAGCPGLAGRPTGDRDDLRLHLRPQRVMRGKQVPADQVDKITSGALRMPLSLLSMDIWGEDIEERAGLGTPAMRMACAISPGGRSARSTGPAARRPSRSSGCGKRTAPFMGDPPGTGCGGRPPQGAGADAGRRDRTGILYRRPSAAVPQPPCSPVTGKRLDSDGALSLDELQHFDAFPERGLRRLRAQAIPPMRRSRKTAPASSRSTCCMSPMTALRPPMTRCCSAAGAALRQARLRRHLHGQALWRPRRLGDACAFLAERRRGAQRLRQWRRRGPKSCATPLPG